MNTKVKQILLSIPICGASLLCQNAQAQWDGNWLMGLYGGLAEREGNVDVIINHLLPAALVSEIIHNQKDNGSIGGLLGGYQVRCHDWLLGAELNVEFQEMAHDHNWAFTSILDEGFNVTTNYKQKNSVGISCRLGYEMYPNFLPYVRLGLQSSRDKLIVRAISSDFVDALDMESIRRVYRLTAGIGAEFPVCFLMGLSVRTEYNFRARGGSIAASELAGDNLTTSTASMRPKTNVVLLALVINLV